MWLVAPPSPLDVNLDGRGSNEEAREPYFVSEIPS